MGSYNAAISGVISRVTGITTHMRGLKTIHEPPSKGLRVTGFRVFGTWGLEGLRVSGSSRGLLGCRCGAASYH